MGLYVPFLILDSLVKRSQHLGKEKKVITLMEDMEQTGIVILVVVIKLPSFRL